MAILELRILPPIAVGRLGASPTPLEAFDLVVSQESPLDYRQIVPRETLRVDPKTGAIAEAFTPTSIRFKETDGTIRPVAPFLEVFAITDAAPGELVPLTADLLKQHDLKLKDLSWCVDVGNIKIFRRTNDPADKIGICIPKITDHKRHDLLATCDNFRPEKTLPLGSVQFIKPTEKFPQIRLRYTPAAGKVYGSALTRHTSPTQEEPDPIIDNDDLILYDIKKGTWRGYTEGSGPTLTNPAQIFAGYNLGNDRVSWGYLDDECDGFVTVTLNRGKGQKALSARAYIGAGPPAFAPDTLPIRVVSDELEQIILGPEVTGEVPIDEAEEIVRRALETIRLMNTTVMNGNTIEGRTNVASTMVRQDTNDFERLYEPIMATSIVDNLALRALHERVFAGLSSGAAPWFADVLRRPNEIGDLSDEFRRKMPALMRNADGRALCLTHRHINAVIRAAANAMFQATAADPLPEPPDPSDEPALKPGNLAAQIHFRGTGNPFSVLPRTAISNCFPGLEYDFRNLWRRTFEGIVLIENNNYVVDAELGYEHLKTRRLLSIDDGTRKSPTMVVTTGPVFPGGDSVTLISTANPNAVSFMEWSNSLAHILQMQGKQVKCYFTKEENATTEVLADKAETIEVTLTVRKFFEGDSAAFAPGLLEPGELTQGLCAPWQNDYRECACYYWAASRPDYVNVEPSEDGLSHGDSWLAKKRTGSYILDNRTDTRLVSYDDLFKDWQKELSFIIRGRDAEVSPTVTAPEGGS